MRQRARRRLAFAKSLHSRLGENSVMGDLDPETYSKIESLMQRGGGLNKNQIITVENRNRYVGQVIEIVPIHVFDDHLIDDSGGEEIKNFMNKICKIANTDQYDIDYYGDNITNVSNAKTLVCLRASSQFSAPSDLETKAVVAIINAIPKEIVKN